MFKELQQGFVDILKFGNDEDLSYMKSIIPEYALHLAMTLPINPSRIIRVLPVDTEYYHMCFVLYLGIPKELYTEYGGLYTTAQLYNGKMTHFIFIPLDKLIDKSDEKNMNVVSACVGVNIYVSKVIARTPIYNLLDHDIIYWYKLLSVVDTIYNKLNLTDITHEELLNKLLLSEVCTYTTKMIESSILLLSHLRGKVIGKSPIELLFDYNYIHTLDGSDPYPGIGGKKYE